MLSIYFLILIKVFVFHCLPFYFINRHKFFPTQVIFEQLFSCVVKVLYFYHFQRRYFTGIPAYFTDIIAPELIQNYLLMFQDHQCIPDSFMGGPNSLLKERSSALHSAVPRRFLVNLKATEFKTELTVFSLIDCVTLFFFFQ